MPRSTSSSRDVRAVEPNKRQAAAQATRRQLLDAGFAVAETTGLMGLSVNRLVEAAGVSKGTFFHHFGDRPSYLIALHREFHDRLDERIATATAGHEPGAVRLDAAATVYLDECLSHRGVRALLLEARAEPLIAAEIAARSDANAARVVADMAALGWPYPQETARLWVGLVAEAALLELAAGRRRPKVRAALSELVRRDV